MTTQDRFYIMVLEAENDVKKLREKLRLALRRRRTLKDAYAKIVASL